MFSICFSLVIFCLFDLSTNQTSLYWCKTGRTVNAQQWVEPQFTYGEQRMGCLLWPPYALSQVPVGQRPLPTKSVTSCLATQRRVGWAEASKAGGLWRCLRLYYELGEFKPPTLAWKGHLSRESKSASESLARFPRVRADSADLNTLTQNICERVFRLEITPKVHMKWISVATSLHPLESS